MSWRSWVAVTFSVAATAFWACRKPVPEERVYTGPASGGTGGNAVGGAGGGAGTAATGGSAGAAGGGLGGAPPDLPFTKQNLLAQVADCAVAHYAAFETRAKELSDKTAAYAGDPSEDNRQAARTAWALAIDRWQEAELFRFGPAARPKDDPGGQDIRDNIYSWPLVSRCKIEEQIVSEAYAAPDFAQTLANGRGLWAAEYLLFYPSSDNACSQFSPINANGTWSALGATTLALRKAKYAHAIALDVHARAQALLKAWDPAAGNFRRELLLGEGSSVYESEQHALNAVSDALFYVEMEVKDLKLGTPVGLNECFSTSCPEAVESPFAQRSIEHIRRNLVAFRRLFQGCYADYAGLGFDDWLRAVGAGALADDMTAAIVQALAALDAIPPPLEQAVVQDPLPVKTAHAAIKTITDPLKTELVTVLNLELPLIVQTDND
jgi:predicted lipoprotein